MSRNCTPADQKEANTLLPLSNGQALWSKTSRRAASWPLVSAGPSRRTSQSATSRGRRGSVMSMMRRSPRRPWVRLNE